MPVDHQHPPHGLPGARPVDPGTSPTIEGHAHQPRRRLAVTVAATVGVAALVLAGCGTSGRTLRDPAPGATAPPRKGAATTSTAPAVLDTLPVEGLSVSSSAWTPGGEIPIGYTCDGQDISPPLTISSAPPSTAELLVVVTDQDAGGLVHWVVAGVAPGASEFLPGELPVGAVELPNSTGEAGWLGPCPPSGETHTYDITVHALDGASGLQATSTQAEIDTVLGLVIASSAMTGTYTRA